MNVEREVRKTVKTAFDIATFQIRVSLGSIFEAYKMEIEGTLAEKILAAKIGRKFPKS